MATYPSVVGTLTNPLASQTLNSPSHSSIHSAVNTEVLQVETFVGTLSSAVGTLVYDIRAAASNGGGHVQTANTGGTGQTTYATGDVLVGISPSTLSKLAVSATQGYALVVDNTQATGLKWGLPGNIPSILAVNTSSVFTYVKPSVFSYLRVKVWGGGGGTGGGTPSGPGGGGGYSESFIPASSVAANVTVVVAAAGPNASVGGTTAFGSVLTASGGNAGNSDPGSGNIVNGGTGGSGSGGQVNLSGGQAPSQSRLANAPPTAGGLAPLGGVVGQGASGTNTGQTAVGAQPGMIIIETF